MHLSAHGKPSQPFTHLLVLLWVAGIEAGHRFLQASVAAGLASHSGSDKHEAVSNDGGLKQLDDLWSMRSYAVSS